MCVCTLEKINNNNRKNHIRFMLDSHDIIYHTFSLVFDTVFEGLYGWMALLSLCQSFTITEGLSGSLRVFPFVFAKGLQGRWSRTCLDLSDPQQLSLCGFLWVAEGLC